MKRESRHLPLHLHLPVCLHLAVDNDLPPPLHHLLPRLQGHQDWSSGALTIHQLLASHFELERLSLGAISKVASDRGEVRRFGRGNFGRGKTRVEELEANARVKCVIRGQIFPT